MAARLQQRTQDKQVRVQTALEKDNSPLSCEKVYFMTTCCQILRMNSDERANIDPDYSCGWREGRPLPHHHGDLETIGDARAEAHRRTLPPPIRPPAMQKIWRPMCAALGTWRKALGGLNEAL
jgi:hypothetical protein